MNKRIFRSILLVAGVVLLASFLIILDCLYGYFSNLQEGQLRDELSLAASAVEEEGESYLSRLRPEGYRLTWVGEDGGVLYDTQADAGQMENHKDRTEIQDALKLGPGQSSRYSSTLMEKTLYFARRLKDGSVLRISVSRATAWRLVPVSYTHLSLVVRVRNNENRRVVWLEPTEQALEIAREVQRALVEELSRIFGQLKDDSLQESLQAMRTINHILERFPSSSTDEKEV